MGWIVFGGVVAVIIVLAKKSKKKKCIAAFKESAGLEVALQIKDALTQAGYKVSEFKEESISYISGDCCYYFDVGEGYPRIGCIQCDYYSGGYKSHVWDGRLMYKNTIARKGTYYAIYNDNINLLVESEQETNEVPPFLEIAARVISSSGYKFRHPEVMSNYPESREWLNVMFQ